ncbi:MAG: hypothetical protein H6709_25215, partial [Kofleriaceae bacterium]|nr:hypothetical protein [Kofleriaceae bacterium]
MAQRVRSWSSRLAGTVLAAALGVAVVLGAAGVAAADVGTFAVEGSAPADLGDARTAALDQAFQAATAAALDELTTAAARAPQADTITTEVLRRARLWVASFKVTSQRTAGDRLELSVAVRIDLDKLRAKLEDLGVPLGGDAGPAPVGSHARGATMLLRLQTPEGVTSTYGPSGDASLGLAVLVGPVLATRGLVPVPAPGSGPRAHG